MTEIPQKFSGVSGNNEPFVDRQVFLAGSYGPNSRRVLTFSPNLVPGNQAEEVSESILDALAVGTEGDDATIVIGTDLLPGVRATIDEYARTGGVAVETVEGELTTRTGRLMHSLRALWEQGKSPIAVVDEEQFEAVRLWIQDVPDGYEFYEKSVDVPKLPQQTFVEWSDACEMTEYASRLELPYGLVTRCGAKAAAIVLKLCGEGVNPAVLGFARSYIPDLSAEGIQRAYETGESMYAPPTSALSFSDRLQRSHDIAHVGENSGAVEFDNIRIQEAQPGFILLQQVGAVTDNHIREGLFAEDFMEAGWRLESTNRKILFCNHTAATIQTRFPDGSLATGAIDPSYDPSKPLNLSDWKDRQNFPKAVVLSHGMLEERLRAHTELMTDESRMRFRRAVTDNHALESEDHAVPEVFDNLPLIVYERIMSQFLNLQDPKVSLKAPYSIYAFHLADTILKGREYALPREPWAAQRKADSIIDQFDVVRVYQDWLDQTENKP